MKVTSEQKPVTLYNRRAAYTEQDCACGDECFSPSVLHSQDQQTAETDCACPDTGLVSVAPVEKDVSTCWQVSPDLYRATLTGTHELVFNPVGPAGVVVLNTSACAILDSFDQSQSLKNDPTIYQLASLGLIQPCDFPPIKPPVETQTLTTWLHITNECNFSCTYCYLTKTDEIMEETTGRTALDTIFRSAIQHGFKAVKLKYAGGEPTLNFSLLQTLHQYAHGLSEQSGITLHEVILTNGTGLTDEMLAYIHNAGMRLMISLDGGSTGHNIHRTFANGKNTFAPVARKIDRAIEYGIRPHLSITVTKDNADSLTEAVQFALERELQFNLNFYRHNRHFDNENTLQADDERLIVNLRSAFSIIERSLPRHNLIAGLLDRANFSYPHYHTCGAGRNYLVIDHYGRVAHCQMEINRTVTDIHHNDPLSVVRNTPAQFRNLPVDEKEDCRICKWRYGCAGGCPLLSASGQSPYCHVYQTLFPELLRLEGLRLLKWQLTE